MIAEYAQRNLKTRKEIWQAFDLAQTKTRNDEYMYCGNVRFAEATHDRLLRLIAQRLDLIKYKKTKDINVYSMKATKIKFIVE